MPAKKFKKSQIISTREVTTPEGKTIRHTVVELTPKQKAHYEKLAAQFEAEVPPKKRRGKKPRPRLEVVLTENDSPLLDAVDNFAALNKLPNRGAVVRVALGQFFGIPLEIPHHGWQPGRPRKSKKTARES